MKWAMVSIAAFSRESRHGARLDECVTLEVAAAGGIDEAADADSALADNHTAGRGRGILRRGEQDVGAGIVARFRQLAERNPALDHRLERNLRDRSLGHLE